MGQQTYIIFEALVNLFFNLFATLATAVATVILHLSHVRCGASGGVAVVAVVENVFDDMLYYGRIGNQALARKIDGFVIVICVCVPPFFLFLRQDRLGNSSPNCMTDTLNVLV